MPSVSELNSNDELFPAMETENVVPEEPPPNDFGMPYLAPPYQLHHPVDNLDANGGVQYQYVQLPALVPTVPAESPAVGNYAPIQQPPAIDYSDFEESDGEGEDPGRHDHRPHHQHNRPLNITVTVVIRHEFPNATTPDALEGRLAFMENQISTLINEMINLTFRNDLLTDLWSGDL